MIRVVFSGSRHWTDITAIKVVLERLDRCIGKENLALYHGAQVGLDSIVHTVAKYLRFRVHGLPADWDSYGNAAGPIRNRELLSYDPLFVLAFPLEHSKGTIDMINECKSRKIPLFVYNEGKFEAYNTDNLDQEIVSCFMEIHRL